MKPEDIQHGGNHYKDQPKHLQPVYLATALKLNPMEYSVLKYLLRHRKKGGLLDLQKMMHFAQMLWEEKHGQAPQITYVTPAVGVEFEFHKQQPDAPLTPLLQSLGLQITDAECAILLCLLRHKRNGEVCELRELLQYGQWLIYSEYGMVAVLKQIGEPIDAEFDTIDECEAVTIDDLPQPPTCPFKIGDVIQHYDPDTSKTKWKITHISGGKLLVTSHDPYQTPSWIEQVFWDNYRRVAPTTIDSQQSCPFKVGDTIRSIKWPHYVFRVTGVSEDQIVVHHQITGTHAISKAKWDGYEVRSLISVDKPATTC
jgi:hypothetical protein